MKTAYSLRGIITVVLLSLLSLWSLTGCAGMGTTGSKYMNERIFEVNYDIDIEEATNRAAKAMQAMEVAVTEQNGASGFLAGRLVTGWWVNKETYFLEVYISTPNTRQVKVHATSIAGPQTAFTNELDDIVEEFYRAYEKSLSH